MEGVVRSRIAGDRHRRLRVHPAISQEFLERPKGCVRHGRGSSQAENRIEDAKVREAPKSVVFAIAGLRVHPDSRVFATRLFVLLVGDDDPLDELFERTTTRTDPLKQPSASAASRARRYDRSATVGLRPESAPACGLEPRETRFDICSSVSDAPGASPAVRFRPTTSRTSDFEKQAGATDYGQR
jgi:hypothetical protein